MEPMLQRAACYPMDSNCSAVGEGGISIYHTIKPTIPIRAVLVFDHRPRSFVEIEKFDWEQPVSSRLKRLATEGQQDFDGQ